MAIVNGQWSGANDSGFWNGSLDDSNLVALNRETNTTVNSISGKLVDTYNEVSGSAGVSASYNLINGLTLGFDAWLDNHAGEQTITWYEVAMQQNRDAERLRGLSTDELNHYNDLVSRLVSLSSRIEQIYQVVTGISGVLSSLVTNFNDFKLTLKRWLHGLVSAFTALLTVAFSPLYRICRADGNTVSGQVTVTPDFEVVYSPGHSIDYIDVLSSSSNQQTGNLTFQSMELDKYGRFSPETGAGYFYYSDELKQVIVRPYRNSGHVYLY